MNRFWKLAAIGVTLALPASAAFADTISIASDSTTVKYQGYAAPGAAFVADPLAAGDAQRVALNGATFDIGTAGVWTGPLAGSSYVSFDANSQPNGTVDANGYYTYSSQFTAIGGLYAETLSLLADDTVAVYLNGVLQVPAALGGNTTCQNNQPNCITPLTQSFIAALNPGTNTLLLVVEQTALSAQGLDFTASFAATPEPNSLILMGSGLLGGAGMLLRRRRSIA